jgi:hypothetical protein
MLDKTKLRIDTFENYVDPIHMKITHMDSGISVNGSGKSRIQLKIRLIKELEEKIEKERSE